MVLRRMMESPILFILVVMDSGLLTVKRKYLQLGRGEWRNASGEEHRALTAYIFSPPSPP